MVGLPSLRKMVINRSSTWNHTFYFVEQTIVQGFHVSLLNRACRLRTQDNFADVLWLSCDSYDNRRANVRASCEVLNIFQLDTAWNIRLFYYHPTAALHLLWRLRFHQQSGSDWSPSENRTTDVKKALHFLISIGFLPTRCRARKHPLQPDLSLYLPPNLWLQRQNLRQWMWNERGKLSVSPPPPKK